MHPPDATETGANPVASVAEALERLRTGTWGQTMRVSTRFMRPQQVVSIAAKGPYEQTLPSTWGQLCDLLNRHQVRDTARPVFALLRDLPQDVRPEDRRLEFCAPITHETRRKLGPEANYQMFAGGAYISQTHRGHHMALGTLFSQLYASCSLDMNIAVDNARPRVLVFKGDPAVLGPEDLMTELCMPVVQRSPDRPRGAH